MDYILDHIEENGQWINSSLLDFEESTQKIVQNKKEPIPSI